jgi:hypothetical protein
MYTVVQIWPQSSKSHYFPCAAEIEFLYINYSKQKNLSLLLQASYSPFYWRILTILYFGFKNTYKKSAKQIRVHS